LIKTDILPSRPAFDSVCEVAAGAADLATAQTSTVIDGKV
jgi:hypothetical protein